MPQWYVDKRTQTVVSVLLRIESYIFYRARAVLARLAQETNVPTGDTESVESLMGKADHVAQYDRKLGPIGVGLSRWGSVTTTGTTADALSSLAALLGKAELFKGSTARLSEEGKQLVDKHCVVLKGLREAAATATQQPDLAGGQHVLHEAVQRLSDQLNEAKPYSLDEAQSSLQSSPSGRGCLVPLLLALLPLGGTLALLLVFFLNRW
jgi:hypothetical protein